MKVREGPSTLIAGDPGVIGMEVDEMVDGFWKKANLFTPSLVTILLFSVTAVAQTAGAPPQTPSAAETVSRVLQPATIEYKSIKIGTTADEVRDKLGKAEIDDKDGFYYRFSDEEFVQIRLDKDDKVRLISVTYSGENAPEFTEVFGDETNVEAKPDGSIYRLVRYPKAGYWVAYSRTGGDKPTTTVTMQKLQTVK